MGNNQYNLLNILPQARKVYTRVQRPNYISASPYQDGHLKNHRVARSLLAQEKMPPSRQILYIARRRRFRLASPARWRQQAGPFRRLFQFTFFFLVLFFVFLLLSLIFISDFFLDFEKGFRFQFLFIFFTLFSCSFLFYFCFFPFTFRFFFCFLFSYFFKIHKMFKLKNVQIQKMFRWPRFKNCSNMKLVQIQKNVQIQQMFIFKNVSD